MKFNINNTVRVKLTDHGRKIHHFQHLELNKQMPRTRVPYRAPTEDAEGWSEWQLWHLIETFGPHVGMGMKQPFETEIEIP